MTVASCFGVSGPPVINMCRTSGCTVKPACPVLRSTHSNRAGPASFGCKARAFANGALHQERVGERGQDDYAHVRMTLGDLEYVSDAVAGTDDGRSPSRDPARRSRSSQDRRPHSSRARPTRSRARFPWRPRPPQQTAPDHRSRLLATREAPPSPGSGGTNPSHRHTKSPHRPCGAAQQYRACLANWSPWRPPMPLIACGRADVRGRWSADGAGRHTNGGLEATIRMTSGPGEPVCRGCLSSRSPRVVRLGQVACGRIGRRGSAP